VVPAISASSRRSRYQAAAANTAGLSRETINQALSTYGDPTLSAMTALMKSLGFRLSFAPIDRATGTGDTGAID
jgi:DNA-binding phage protein